MRLSIKTLSMLFFVFNCIPMQKVRYLEQEPDPLFSATSLQRLAEKEDWFFENTSLTPDRSKRLYDLIPSDIRFDLDRFFNDQARSMPCYKNFLILKSRTGTGKTTLSLAISNHLKIKPFFMLGYHFREDSADYSSVARLTKLFELAKKRKEPTVIIIDSFYSLAYGRYYVLDQLKGSKVFVLLITDKLKGYADDFYKYYAQYAILEMGNPGERAREVMIESLMESSRLSREYSNQKWKEFLVKQTKGLNYFGIRDLFQGALTKAFFAYPKDFPINLVIISKKNFYAAKEKLKKSTWHKIFCTVTEKLKKFSNFCNTHQKTIFFNLILINLIVWSHVLLMIQQAHFMQLHLANMNNIMMMNSAMFTNFTNYYRPHS